MKKLFYYLTFAAMCLVSCNDDSGLFNLMLDTDQRIARLEELCSELNTNITSLQVIVEAQQFGDYITNITPIMKDVQLIGYTITFAKHPAITIYNGTNGTNGQDGKTPILGAVKDTDGIYYWTINGSWLLDSDGSKIRVTGEKGDKGDKGNTGATGQNGTNGKNGTDGVTPQLKIQDDYWYISYDNGSTWTQLGKAKGDKGDTGATGAAGTNGTNEQDGDSMFQSVTYDENKVYFTLADGTQIIINRNYIFSGYITELKLVDLGLPSGTKWANQDLYIDFDTISGDHFYYGATLPLPSTNEETIYINGHIIQSGDSIAGTSFDAATLYYGTGWHIPTEKEFRELFANCDVSVCYVQLFDGSVVDGLKYTSKFNSRSIQFALDIVPSPIVGLVRADYSWYGNYWTSTCKRYLGLSITRRYQDGWTGYQETRSSGLQDASNSTHARIRPVFN